MGLAGVGGYKAYKSLSGREKVGTSLNPGAAYVNWAKKNPKLNVGLTLLTAAPVALLPWAVKEQERIDKERQRQIAEKKEKEERERRNKELAALAATGLIAGAGGYALGSRSKRGE